MAMKMPRRDLVLRYTRTEVLVSWFLLVLNLHPCDLSRLSDLSASLKNAIGMGKGSSI